MAEQNNYFRLDMSRFTRAMAEALPTSRKDAGQFLLMQGRGVVKTLLAITPPGNSHKENTTDAKWRGERAIEGDMYRVVRPTRRKGTPQVNVRALIDAHRSPRTGRTRKPPGGPTWVQSAAFRAELVRRKRLVGLLAAGWVPAADLVGLKRVPAWIRRHRTAGHARLVADSGSIRLTISNASRFASNVKGFQRRVQWAVHLQASRMEDAAASFWAERFRRAGFAVAA